MANNPIYKGGVIKCLIHPTILFFLIFSQWPVICWTIIHTHSNRFGSKSKNLTVLTFVIHSLFTWSHIRLAILVIQLHYEIPKVMHSIYPIYLRRSDDHTTGIKITGANQLSTVKSIKPSLFVTLCSKNFWLNFIPLLQIRTQRSEQQAGIRCYNGALSQIKDPRRSFSIISIHA